MNKLKDWIPIIFIVIVIGLVLAANLFINYTTNKSINEEKAIQIAYGEYMAPLKVKSVEKTKIDYFKYGMFFMLGITCNALYIIKRRIEVQNELQRKLLDALDGAEVTIQE